LKLFEELGYSSRHYIFSLFLSENFNGNPDNVFGGLRSNWTILINETRTASSPAN